MKKKIASIALIVALAAIAIVGASLAYFTDTTQGQTNTFTFGNVEIEVIEEEWDENDVQAVLPGSSYAKDPAIQNVGTNAAWVRMNVKITGADTLLAALQRDNPDSTLLAMFSNLAAKGKWVATGQDPIVDGSEITYTYYYKTKLDADALTDPLFTRVTIPPALTSDDAQRLTAFNMVITADAIQADGFDSAEEAFVEFDK